MPSTNTTDGSGAKPHIIGFLYDIGGLSIASQELSVDVEMLMQESGRCGVDFSRSRRHGLPGVCCINHMIIAIHGCQLTCGEIRSQFQFYFNIEAVTAKSKLPLE